MHTILEQIYQLSDTEFERLQEWLPGVIQTRQASIDRRKREQRHNANNRRQEREREVSTAAREWCKANLQPGMVVKVKGARDGKGFRRVVEVGSSYLVGRQCRTRRVKQYDANGDEVRNADGRLIMTTEFQETGEFTENGLDKVRWVLIDDEWQSIADLTGL